MLQRKQVNAKKHVPAQFILDCSIVLSWYFADESNAYANRIAVSLEKAEALVPTIWPLEVANALIVAERRKRSTEAQAANFLTRLEMLPIIIDEQSTKYAWSSIIRLARTYNLSCYDASYLELAMRSRAALATLDEQLKTAAKAIGVAIY